MRVGELYVSFVHAEEILETDTEAHWQDREESGWRVCGFGSEIDDYLPMRFASKRDAELALYSLRKHGVTTAEDTFEIENKVLFRMMAENLMW